MMASVLSSVKRCEHMPGKNDVIVGSVLKSLREETGMTQREFALRMGADPDFVSNVEDGSLPLRLDEVFDYSAALNLDVHDVLSQIAREVVR